MNNKNADKHVNPCSLFSIHIILDLVSTTYRSFLLSVKLLLVYASEQTGYNTNLVIIIEPRQEKTFLFCICKNKGADQLRGNRAAYQRLSLGYIDSPIHLLSKS